jgi:hypothetical protein
VRHDRGNKSTIEPANVFQARVAPDKRAAVLALAAAVEAIVNGMAVVGTGRRRRIERPDRLMLDETDRPGYPTPSDEPGELAGSALRKRAALP